MTRSEEQAELRLLRAAVGTAHDHLHAGRVDEAHEALHCAQAGTETHPENISTDAAAKLQRFMHNFNQVAQRDHMEAAVVVLVPSASKPGYVSVQFGGSVLAIQWLRRELGQMPTIAAGGD